MTETVSIPGNAPLPGPRIRDLVGVMDCNARALPCRARGNAGTQRERAGRAPGKGLEKALFQG